MTTDADLTAQAAKITLSYAQDLALYSRRMINGQVRLTAGAPSTLRSLVAKGVITRDLVITDLGLAVMAGPANVTAR